MLGVCFVDPERQVECRILARIPRTPVDGLYDGGRASRIRESVSRLVQSEFPGSHFRSVTPQVNHEVSGRRGARLAALTSGGAIPETGDYRVVADSDDTFVAIALARLQQEGFTVVGEFEPGWRSPSRARGGCWPGFTAIRRSGCGVRSSR